MLEYTHTPLSDTPLGRHPPVQTSPLLDRHPPWADTPPEQTPPRRPLQKFKYHLCYQCVSVCMETVKPFRENSNGSIWKIHTANLKLFFK